MALKAWGSSVVAFMVLIGPTLGQNPKPWTWNENPSLLTWECSKERGCVEQDTLVVIDWGNHKIETLDGESCITSSGGVNETLCPDEKTCAKNCFISPVNYYDAGVRTNRDQLTMYEYMREGGSEVSVSPRLYLLDRDGDYKMLHLNGRELTFTVDLSTLPCGMNGALYLSQMTATGGRNRYNQGGARYGSGYCDAQCPVETWRNGRLNLDGEKYCCNEMDVLESNSRAAAVTPHPCNKTSCDPDGCSYNNYRNGYHNYWARGGEVDTTKPITITTQFITNDGTPSGKLIDINQIYSQDGKEIPPANGKGNSVTPEWCEANDFNIDQFDELGGLTKMGKALEEGMVLIFSIWNDPAGNMTWLDTGSAGPCSVGAGAPANIVAQDPTTHVVWSNIRWGELGTTNKDEGQRKQKLWGQCGGIGYSGPKVCEHPYFCHEWDRFFSQCL